VPSSFWRRCSICFALRRGLGDQRRQCSTLHPEGTRDGGARRGPAPGLLQHSDRGCTYTCDDYQTYLAGHCITCSMSRRGACYDNAFNGESLRDGEERGGRAGLPVTATRRWRCSTTSRCFITNVADTRRSASSVRRPSNGVPPQPKSRRGARRQPRANVGC